MQLTPSVIASVQVLTVTGRIDQTHSKSLESALAPYLAQCDGSGLPLLLDFSGVDYISSIGLRVLLMAAKQVQRQHGHIAIADLTPIVAEVFKVSRFDLVFRIFPSVSAATSALAP